MWCNEDDGSRVGLSGVFKVRVRAAGAVDADVARGGNVGAAMGL